MDPNVPEDLKFYTECIEPAYPGTKVVEVHFGGHRVAEALKESGQLSQFIYNYIEGGVIRQIKIKEDEGYIWNAEYAAFLLRNGRLEEAADRALRSMSIKPTIRAANLIGEISRLSGRKVPFSPPLMFRKGVFASKSYSGGLLNALSQLAIGFEQVGDYDVAIKLYEQAVINFPDNQKVKERLESLRSLEGNKH